jgi:hypothetical protein
MSTDVSEEHIASIFRAGKISSGRSQRESMWQAAPAWDEVMWYLFSVSNVLGRYSEGENALKSTYVIITDDRFGLV